MWHLVDFPHCSHQPPPHHLKPTTCTPHHTYQTLCFLNQQKFGLKEGQKCNLVLQILLQLEYGISIQESATSLKNPQYPKQPLHFLEISSHRLCRLSLYISIINILFRIPTFLEYDYDSIPFHLLAPTRFILYSSLSLFSPFSLYFSVSPLHPFVGVIRSCRTQTLWLSHWWLFFIFLLVALQHQVK